MVRGEKGEAGIKRKKHQVLFLYLPKQVLLTNPMLSTDLLPSCLRISAPQLQFEYRLPDNRFPNLFTYRSPPVFHSIIHITVLLLEGHRLLASNH
jgi:hypothetical protein